MRRALNSGLCVLCAVAAMDGLQARSEIRSTGLEPETVLHRFLALDHAPLTQYRARRRFEARNDKFDSTAWMDVWTEADGQGMRNQIVAEGGSSYIRGRVFRGTLEREQRSWAANAHERSAVTAANYSFGGATIEPDGSVRVTVSPRRRDLLLVDGSIVLHAWTADLLRVEGQLSRSPSFWARDVHVVRHYERVAGIQVPIALETTSHIRIAGLSTLTIRWQYESVNGRPAGDPATP